jgi:hypothetical protein
VARSGAHSFAGYSTGDCLVVDLSRLTAVEVEADGRAGWGQERRCCRSIGRCGRDSSAEVAEANVEWTDGLYAAVRRFRSGFAYQNCIDPRLDDWARAYFGANFARLRAVKSRYDPDDLFHFAHSVPLARRVPG